MFVALIILIMSQSSAVSVRDLLPENCLLNLEDDDNETLNLVTDVDGLFYKTTENYDAEVADETDIQVEFELRDEDIKYNYESNAFLSEGCGCKYADGGPCSGHIDTTCLQSYKLNMMELPKETLDLIILSHLQQTRITGGQVKAAGNSQPKERKIATSKFMLFGRQVCKATYLYAHSISKKRYGNLCKHFDTNGVTPRVHKSTHRQPANAFTVNETHEAVLFIRNFAEIHAMPLPGRMPRMKDFSVMMLPSNLTKAEIWDKYVKCCTESGKRAVGLSKFKDLWGLYLPEICVMKVSSDLCDTCQKNNNLIMKTVNADETLKSEKLQIQEKHLRIAQDCRNYYKRQCTLTEHLYNALSDEEKTHVIDGPIHISFDYAQNLQIPHQPQQVGPIYFKTPRKCHLFGICCETIPQQVNYLIDEHAYTGKGANETVSYLEHYFKHHAIKSNKLFLHCDNCRGQNKNNCVMQYLCLRILLCLNTDIECSFMIPYHTCFGPDWCFGLIKLKYKRSFINSVLQLSECVANSTRKNINIPQLVWDPSTNEVLVEVRNWKSFLENHFRKIPQITSYQHFRFSSEHPGDVFVRELPNSEEKKITLLKRPINYEAFVNPPPVVNPAGLSPDRAWYLYDNIREHCGEDFQDVTCPKPQMNRPRLQTKSCQK